MKKKILKKLTITFISLAALFSTSLVWACAIWFDEDEMNYSFFAPETSRADAYTPFYRSMHLLYGNEINDPIGGFNQTNTEEWAAYFKKRVADKDVEMLLYKSRAGEIDSLIGFMNDQKYPCSDKLRTNSILKIKDKDAVKSFLQYLQFAKRCEPYVTFTTDPWDEEDHALDLQKHPERGVSLLAEAEKLMNACRSDFIKQRYVFQLTRLYFFCNRYEECLQFYRKQLPVFTDQSSMRYRSMGYAAASLYKLKRYGEANYFYSLIYDQCAEMKIAAYSSFHPLEEADWNACLAQAKNARETTVIWQLLGIYADPLRAMKEIYKLDPSSDLLDLLVARAVNQEEEKFMPVRESYEMNADTIYSFKTTAINKELIDFLSGTATKGNTHKPYLWNLSAGYLYIVQGSFKEAEGFLEKVKTEIKDDSLILKQVREFEIISFVEQEQILDAAFESRIVEELKWLSQPQENDLRNESLYSWLLRRLADKYNSIGELAKAQCLNSKTDKYFYESKQKTQQMISYMDKPNKTTFDAYIQDVYPYKKTDIFDLEGLRLLYQYKFKEAVSKFEECPGSGSTMLLADPFIIHINDCHDCDFQALETKKYSKLGFAKKMLALENKLKSNPKNAAIAFELANGYYNMTYFGNSRFLYQNNIKSYPDEMDWAFESQGISWFSSYYMSRNAPMLDCKLAENYYKLAMDLSADVEFKAKCCFMASKAEQNAYYVNPSNPSSDTYFQLLEHTFGKTNYYKEVIKECGYFAAYVKARK
jgi:hypothetical protein